MLTPEQNRRNAAAIDLGILLLEDAPLNRARILIKFAEYLAAETPVLTTTLGPCAGLATGWPFDVPVGEGAMLWTEQLRHTIDLPGAGCPSLVDEDLIQRQLGWGSAAASLEKRYRKVGPEPCAVRAGARSLAS